MPTFVFFQHTKEVARLQGASKEPIEQTIKKFYKDSPSKDIGYVRDQISFLLFMIFSIHILPFNDLYRQISSHL
jgi:hypothetical protein